MFCNLPEYFRVPGSLNGKRTNFKEKIIIGSKIHALKMDKSRFYKIGSPLVICYNCRLAVGDFIKEVTVVSTQNIQVKYERPGTPDVFIDGRRLGIIEILCLAANEGFETADDFFQYYSENTERKIVHWTDFSYDGNLKRLQEVNDRHKAFNQM